MIWTERPLIRTRFFILNNALEGGGWFNTIIVPEDWTEGNRGEWWYEMDERSSDPNAVVYPPRPF